MAKWRQMCEMEEERAEERRVGENKLPTKGGAVGHLRGGGKDTCHLTNLFNLDQKSFRQRLCRGGR